MLCAGTREEKSEVVVHLGDRPDRGPRVAVGGLLVDRDCRRETLDEVDVRLVHLAQKLPRVCRERLDVPALAFGEDRVEGQRGLPRARQASEDDQLVARQVEVDVAQVVLARAADPELVTHGEILCGVGDIRTPVRSPATAVRWHAPAAGLCLDPPSENRDDGAIRVFAVTSVYDDRAELRSVVRPANRHFLGERFAAGEIFASGPVDDDAAPGALLVVNAENPEHVAELVDGDLAPSGDSSRDAASDHGASSSVRGWTVRSRPRSRPAR